MKTEKPGFYARAGKRAIDFCLSLPALAVLSPLLLILTVTGAVAMRGNPFFVQERPGKRGRNGKEKIFRLVKFRTMSNRRAPNGELLPDAERLGRYGRLLRATSLDELPELFNILVGDMALVGPRPLLVEYLPWYTEEERHRHDVRPGLTGWAQVHGRNSVKWEDRFALDVAYTKHITLGTDLKILFMTVQKVFRHADVASDTRTVEGNFAAIRKAQAEKQREPSEQEGDCNS